MPLFIFSFFRLRLLSQSVLRRATRRSRRRATELPCQARPGRRNEAASRALQATAPRVHYATTGGELNLILFAILREKRATRFCNAVSLISEFCVREDVFICFLFFSFRFAIDCQQSSGEGDEAGRCVRCR